jgi:hypothetical protein
MVARSARTFQDVGDENEAIFHRHSVVHGPDCARWLPLHLQSQDRVQGYTSGRDRD